MCVCVCEKNLKKKKKSVGAKWPADKEQQEGAVCRMAQSAGNWSYGGLSASS